MGPDEINGCNQEFEMRRHLLSLMLAFVSVSALASPKGNTIFNKNHMNVSVHGRYQHMLDGHGMYNEVTDTYGSALAGVQVGFTTHPSDSSWWSNAYNYPGLSIGFSYDNTGSLKTKPNTSFGDFYNLYLALDFDFFRAGVFSMGPVIELGASFCSDRYDPPRNMARFIGSTVVANLACGLEARVRFLPQWEFALTGNLIHHSNGMLRVPNWGTNQAAVGAKLKYYLTPQQTDKRIALEKPAFSKGVDWNIYTAYGVHSCDWELHAKGPESYPVKPRLRAILGAEVAWRYHRLLSTGVGIEGNYADNTYRENDLAIRGMEDPAGYSSFYTSVHFLQNLHYQNFSLHFAWGVYTFKKTGLVEDMGRCFQRIGARYHLPPFKTGQMFLGFDMRAHMLDRSYCLEYSVGITF